VVLSTPALKHSLSSDLPCPMNSGGCCAPLQRPPQPFLLAKSSCQDLRTKSVPPLDALLAEHTTIQKDTSN